MRVRPYLWGRLLEEDASSPLKAEAYNRGTKHMTDSTYNGWKNWATWNVALWIDNEEPLYRCKQAFIRRSYREIEAEDVERFCLDLFPDKRTPDFDNKSDWLDVDWQEIADNWNAEKAEDEAA